MFKYKAVCQMNFFQLSFVTKCLLTQNAQTSVAPITFIYIYVYVYIYIYIYHIIYIYIYIYDITYYVSSLTVIVIIFYKMLCIIYYNIFIYKYILFETQSLTHSMKQVIPQVGMKVCPLRQLSLMKEVFKAHFVLKRFLILTKECFQRLRFKFWKKHWILHPFRSL